MANSNSSYFECGWCKEWFPYPADTNHPRCPPRDDTIKELARMYTEAERKIHFKDIHAENII